MSIRDLFVEIGMDIDDGPLGDLDKKINAVMKAVTKMDFSGFDDLGNDVDDLGKDFNDLGEIVWSVERKLNNFDDGNINDISKSAHEAEGAFGKLKGTIIGIGSAIGAYIAVDKIVGLGTSALESAASAKAMESQFEQVFAGMENSATSALDKIATETGILPNRLKGSYIQMAAFAKTTGVDTAEALKLTERATLAAADSAAFYDRSIEDVTENLQSFLKGNFENDAALGISATETTRNAKANELYGQSFVKLSEAQKQLTLLAMVEDGNKLSGAIGQAARESDSWENQLGNLKSAWDGFLIKLGSPILDQAVDILTNVGEALSNIDPGPFMEFVSSGFDKLSGVKDTLSEVVSAVKETMTSLTDGTGDISGIWEGLGFPPEIADNIASFAETVSSVFTTVKSAVSDFVENVVIPLMPQAQEIIGVAFEYIGNIVSGAMNIFETISGIVRGLIENVIVPLFPVAQEVISVAMDIISPILRVVGSLFEGITAVVKFLVNEVIVPLFPLAVGAIEGAWAILKPILSAISKAFNGVADAVDWVIDKVGAAAEAISNFSVGDALSGAAKWVGGLIPGFEIGLGRVPFDEMPALLHKNEAVLPADEADKLRDRGILQGDGTHPEINLDQATQFEPAKDYSATETVNNNTSNNSKVSAPIQIIVQGSDNPQQTAYSVKDALEELFGDLLRVMPVPREG